MKPTVKSLLNKDLAEHTYPLFFLGIAFVLISLIVLGRAVSSAMDTGISTGFYTILLTLMPLVAFIVGNRLIVREYIGKTRLFLEALPVSAATPLVIKYVLGYGYLVALTIVALLLTMGVDDAGDITINFAGILLLKSLTLVLVLWSLIFSISLLGRLRMILYLLVGAIVYYLMADPTIDTDRFGPFALLDSQLFAHERDEIPWMQIGQTIITAAVITAIGFAIALFNEGSLAETLAKPMGRQDIVALTIVGFSALVIFPVLSKDWKRVPYVFSGSNVVRSEDPAIAIRYDDPKQRVNSQKVVDRLGQTMRLVRQQLGITSLPRIRISMNTDLHQQDVRMWTTDGVIMEANFGDYSTFQNTVLEAHALHGMLQLLTDNRAIFEPRHWVLDGLTRWWATTPLNEKDRAAYDAQVVARAVLALDRSPITIDLISNWQVVADTVGLLAAEALAYTAVEYFQQTHGMAALTTLARYDLTTQVPAGIRGPLNDRRISAQERFEEAAGVSWSTFMVAWRNWLSKQRKRPEIARYLAVVPAISGTIKPRSTDGVLSLVGLYEKLPEYKSTNPQGKCQINHQSISPFDYEIWLDNDNRVDGGCKLEGIAHQIDSRYAQGDRVYVTLGYEHPMFDWPILLHTARITMK